MYSRRLNISSVVVVLGFAWACDDDSSVTSGANAPSPDAAISDGGESTTSSSSSRSEQAELSSSQERSTAEEQSDNNSVDDASPVGPSFDLALDASTVGREGVSVEALLTSGQVDASDAAPAESEVSSGDAAGPSSWLTCGPGLCTTVHVPVDYSVPDGETIGIRVFWGRAAAQERQGVLFFNPGGPGAPMLTDEYYADLYALFNAIAPAMDVILMDNRGIGASEQVRCMSAAEFDLRSNAVETYEGVAGLWTELNDACVESMGATRLANMHTRNVARDMDQVRQLLAVDVIDAWVVSYGTVQGASYAKLFPEHVRAFVLDSPVFLGNDNLIDDVFAGAEAYEHELGRFLEWCAGKEACNLGDTPDAVAATYDGLRSELQAGVNVGGVVLDDWDLASAAGDLLMYGEWDVLAAVVAAGKQGDWSVLAAVQSPEVGDPEVDWQFSQANLLYRLMDYGCPAGFGVEDAVEAAAALPEAYPRMGSLFVAHVFPCAGWYTAPAEHAVEPSNLQGPPMLVVTSAHDAATPLDGALALQAQFNNDSLLYVSEKEGHGVLGADVDATFACGEFLAEGESQAFCSQLECREVGQSPLPLNALRVTTKPASGRQRLPALLRLPLPSPLRELQRSRQTERSRM